jgi:putative oxidoreductase
MKALKLEFLDKYKDFGLLIMRLGLGAAFIAHGWPKMVGGPDKWAGYGARFEAVSGIGFWPEFWGFMAAFAELGGGILLILGLLTRPAALLLVITMIVAALHHFNAGDGFSGYSHAMEAAFTFFGIFFLGAGKYSVDEHLK